MHVICRPGGPQGEKPPRAQFYPIRTSGPPELGPRTNNVFDLLFCFLIDMIV